MRLKLFAPKEFWDMPPEMRGDCGPGSGLGDRLVPDKILFLSIRVACSIHDLMYALGETIEDKKAADRVFLNNMVRIIRGKGGLLKTPRLFLAYIYHLAVKHGGGMAYWKGKNSPVEFRETEAI